MATKIYKQRRSQPYNSKGKTTFNIQGKPGVYIIYKGDRVKYIGYSGSNLYKAMYRHFQKWNDRSQRRITYRDLSDITVRVIYTTTAGQASKLEKLLIFKYKPSDNPMQYETQELTTNDHKKISEYINEPTKDIARFEEDLPF